MFGVRNGIGRGQYISGGGAAGLLGCTQTCLGCMLVACGSGLIFRVRVGMLWVRASMSGVRFHRWSVLVYWISGAYAGM